MAGAGNSRRASEGSRYSRTKTADHDRRTYTYIDGTAVRKLDVQTQPEKIQESESAQVSLNTRRNRERALQMNLGYVLFLTAAAVITVFVCVNFLQLRAKNTLLQEEVASLEAELDSAVLEKASEYNRVMNGIDLEYIKDVATNELGMRQATSDQIVYYEVEDGDYVRQYSEVPEE
ncbi:MAG: hypothetical protein LUI07_03650 [Lachnospiraceae bacterium]|nr:hypothetical protein [Lachnospiraceae bacterium]